MNRKISIYLKKNVFVTLFTTPFKTLESVYIHGQKNIGTLGKYDQRKVWKCICIINPFNILFFLNHKIYLSLDNKNLKWGGKYHNKINVLATINGTLLFNTFLNLHLPV